MRTTTPPDSIVEDMLAVLRVIQTRDGKAIEQVIGTMRSILTRRLEHEPTELIASVGACWKLDAALLRRDRPDCRMLADVFDACGDHAQAIVKARLQ